MSTKNKQFITVVTVVFNGRELLEKTIQSVINQTYKNIEYIIIDGGSIDGTLDVIKKYENNIDLWISEKDKGIYDAMNKGISKAAGEWINFMNAGDVYFSVNTIKEIVVNLSGDLVYGNHALYRTNPDQYDIVNVKNYSDKRNIPFCHQSLFARKQILTENLFNIYYRIAADYDQYLRIKYSGYIIKWVPIVVAKVLQGGVSDRSRLKIINEYYHVCRKYNKAYSLIWYIVRVVKYFVIKK